MAAHAPRVGQGHHDTVTPIGTPKRPLPVRREGRSLSSVSGHRFLILVEAPLVFPQ